MPSKKSVKSSVPAAAAAVTLSTTTPEAHYGQLELHFPEGYHDDQFLFKFYSALQTYWESDGKILRMVKEKGFFISEKFKTAADQFPIRYVILRVDFDDGNNDEKALKANTARISKFINELNNFALFDKEHQQNVTRTNKEHVCYLWTNGRLIQDRELATKATPITVAFEDVDDTYVAEHGVVLVLTEDASGISNATETAGKLILHNGFSLDQLRKFINFTK